MPGPSRLASAEFAPGDLLVIFSDGIPESRNTSGTTFGVDGIVRTVAAAGTGAPEFILQEIVRAVAEFTGETAPADDQTLLVISREI
jgi:serine phosphatase RsbU (regulator of sigma subunit)